MRSATTRTPFFFSMLMAARYTGDETSKLILWPQYFDARASRLTGRRVSKKMSVKSPTIEELLQATRAAGFRVYIDPDKAYPRYWWNPTGRLVVEKSAPKTKVIERVASELKRIRSEASGAE